MAMRLFLLQPERVGGFLFEEAEAEGSGTWTQSTVEGGVAVLETR